MLAYVKYGSHSSYKQSSIFPRLVGSKRKLKTQNCRNDVPIEQLCNKQLFHRQMQEQEFLTRMKKARNIILSHQRRNKPDNKSNTEPIQQFQNDCFQKRNLKSFSQIVYNIKSPINKSKKKNKHHSSESEVYNDKLMRECKSQFMSSGQKSNKKFVLELSNKRKQHNRGSKEFKNNRMFSDNIIFTEKNSNGDYIYQQNQKQSSEQKQAANQSRHNIKNKKKQQMSSAEHLLMKLDLSEQIMNSNGSQLIKKLLKCKSQKRQNQQKQTQKVELKEQNDADSDKYYLENENLLHFPYGNQITTKMTPGKLRLKLMKKQRNKLKFPLHHSKINQINLHQQLQKINLKHSRFLDNSLSNDEKSSDRPCDGDQQDSRRKVNETERKKNKLRQKQQRNREKIINSNMNKFLLNPQCKIQGWKLKQTVQFQLL